MTYSKCLDIICQKKFNSAINRINELEDYIKSSTESNHLNTINLQNSLEDLKQKFSIIVGHCYDWEYWKGLDNKYIWVSPSCERICGYTPNDFINSEVSIQKIVYEEDAILWENHLEEMKFCRVQSPHIEIEFRIINSRGEIVWISHTCKAIYNSLGIYTGRRGCNRDITEKKTFEISLKKNQTLLKKHLSWKENILNTSAVAILVVINDRIIADVNIGFEELFGYSKQELIGNSVRMIHVNGELFEQYGKINWSQTSTTKLVNCEWELKKKDNTKIFCEVSGSAINPDDLSEGVIWIVTNITQKKKYETELIYSQKAAEAANK